MLNNYKHYQSYISLITLDVEFYTTSYVTYTIFTPSLMFTAQSCQFVFFYMLQQIVLIFLVCYRYNTFTWCHGGCYLRLLFYQLTHEVTMTYNQPSIVKTLFNESTIYKHNRSYNQQLYGHQHILVKRMSLQGADILSTLCQSSDQLHLILQQCNTK